MLWAELRDSLCDLYPAVADAERVATDAGMGTRYLAFDGTCTQVWERVLREARRRGMLLDLVRVAEREYPENGPVKIARVILESDGLLREMPVEGEGEAESEMASDPRRGANDDLLFRYLERLEDKLEQLRAEGEQRGRDMAKDAKDERHDLRDKVLQPLMLASDAHGAQIKAQATQMESLAEQLRAHAAQMESQAGALKQQAKQLDGIVEREKKRDAEIAALEERPETAANRAIIWIALAVGLTAALGGDLLSWLAGALWG